MTVAQLDMTAVEEIDDPSEIPLFALQEFRILALAVSGAIDPETANQGEYKERYRDYRINQSRIEQQRRQVITQDDLPPALSREIRDSEILPEFVRITHGMAIGILDRCSIREMCRNILSFVNDTIDKPPEFSCPKIASNSFGELTELAQPKKRGPKSQADERNAAFEWYINNGSPGFENPEFIRYLKENCPSLQMVGKDTFDKYLRTYRKRNNSES